MMGPPPMGLPSAPAEGPELLQRGDHQRLGQMRNGASKRRMDEADNSQQGAPQVEHARRLRAIEEALMVLAQRLLCAREGAGLDHAGQRPLVSAEASRPWRAS